LVFYDDVAWSFYHLHRGEQLRPLGLPGYPLTTGFVVSIHQSGGEAAEATWPPRLPPTLHRLHITSIYVVSTIHAHVGHSYAPPPVQPATAPPLSHHAATIARA
jgi:hypothetical protein